jgi:hypothetical protein
MSASFVALAVTVAIEIALYWRLMTADDSARYQRRPRPMRAYQ